MLLLNDDKRDCQNKGDTVRGVPENSLWSESWRMGIISAFSNLTIEMYSKKNENLHYVDRS